MLLEDRIAKGVAVFLLLILACWGLVGSVLYVWHSEALQRTAQAQAVAIQQLQGQLQQYDAALRAARGPSPQADR